MKRQNDMINELSEDDEKMFALIAESERSDKKSEQKSMKGHFYLQKMMKRNDESSSQRKSIEQENYQMIMRQPSLNHKRFSIIEFDDALVLKILINQNSDLLRKFCQCKNMNFRLRRDKKPAFIEVFGLNQQEIYEQDLEEFNNLVMNCKVTIRNQIMGKEIKCNQDEYSYINKQLDDYIEHLNYTEIKFVDPEGNQDELNPEIVYNPELIRSYQVNQKFILKLSKIEKPAILGFSNIDLLMLNIESDRIYADSFGYELAQKNKLIKQLIKKNKAKLQNEQIIYDQIFQFENKTSKTQEKCIENLKDMLKKIDKQELSSKGFLNIGLALNQKCGKKYIQDLLRHLNKISDEDTYLSFPSEINLFINEEKEQTIISYLNDAIKNKNINPDKIKKGGQWSYGLCYYGQNLKNNAFYQINMNQMQNVQTTNFKESATIALERGYLKDDKKVYIATPPLHNVNNGLILYNNSKRKRSSQIKQKDEDEEFIEEVQVDFDKMTETFLQSKLERPISQDPKKKTKWQYIDTINQDFADFEEELCKVFKSCQDNGQKQFIYQRNLIDFTLHSHIMKCEFAQNMMTDMQTGDIYIIKREENSKYNYLVEEADPSTQSERIDIVEQKKVLNKRDRAQDQIDELELLEKKKFGPHLKIRGLKENIDLVNELHDNMKKNKTAIHIISLDKKIPKSNQKFLEEIALQNNIDLEYSEKREELVLKGFKKTINRLRNQFIKGLSIKFDDFTAPDDWAPQDKDVEVFDVKLDTEYAKHVIKLVKKSLPNAKVHKIERIQNLKLWRNFCFEKKKLEDKGDTTEKWLFHGTRNTSPSVIYSGSEEGFDFRVCSGGMYGRGTYFHDMASYSYNFGHNKGGKMQLFCAKVLLGKCYATAPNGQMTAPPYIPGSKSIRYDSIRSNNAIGQNEYVIFNNNKAYPYYLVTLVNGAVLNGGGFGGFNNNKIFAAQNDDEEEEEEDFEEYNSEDY